MVETIGAIPEINFQRRRGDTYAFVVTLKTSAGAALNITGASFLLTIDPQPDPSGNTANLAQVTGAILGSPTAGQVQFTPSAPAVGTVGTFFYDVQMTEAGGGVRTVLKGRWTVEQDITK